MQPGTAGRFLKMNSTVLAILNESKNRLQAAGVDRPELAAEILAADAFNCPRLELALRLHEKLASARAVAIEQGIRRLEKHEPIQYVLGKTDFMGHVLKCDRRALIPRPETEELVESILGFEPLWQADAPAIIDIGTGNGCIIITLALRKKNGKYIALDSSAGAIALAEENARRHGVAHAIKFITADLAGWRAPRGLDAVAANPPYVRTADFHDLEKNVRLWEPRAALDGGADGLRVIRPLVKKSYEILKPGGFLFMEIGFDQWPQVRQLLAASGFSRSAARPDCSGHDRLITAVKPAQTGRRAANNKKNA
jgi:release factor glutamine methyltransferase